MKFFWVPLSTLVSHIGRSCPKIEGPEAGWRWLSARKKKCTSSWRPWFSIETKIHAVYHFYGCSRTLRGTLECLGKNWSSGVPNNGIWGSILVKNYLQKGSRGLRRGYWEHILCSWWSPSEPYTNPYRPMLGTYYDQNNSKHRILLSNGRKHTKTMVSEAIGVYIEVSGQFWCHFPSINAKYIFASRHPFLTFDTPYPAHYVGPTKKCWPFRCKIVCWSQKNTKGWSKRTGKAKNAKNLIFQNEVHFFFLIDIEVHFFSPISNIFFNIGLKKKT